MRSAVVLISLIVAAGCADPARRLAPHYERIRPGMTLAEVQTVYRDMADMVHVSNAHLQEDRGRITRASFRHEGLSVTVYLADGRVTRKHKRGF